MVLTSAGWYGYCERSGWEEEHRDDLLNKIWHTAPNLHHLLSNEMAYNMRLGDIPTLEILAKYLERDRRLWVEKFNAELMPGGDPNV